MTPDRLYDDDVDDDGDDDVGANICLRPAISVGATQGVARRLISAQCVCKYFYVRACELSIIFIDSNVHICAYHMVCCCNAIEMFNMLVYTCTSECHRLCVLVCFGE